MRRVLFFIAIFLFTLSSVMGQMIPINLPADGNWPTIVGDSIMIIGPRQNELTEEQRYFNPVYLMTYPGKEHLKAQMIRAGACDCDPTKPNRRIGVFSVAPDKQVSFSQGNLQYLPAINLWKFANTQYEYLGNANKYLKPTFRNWVDLFGWSASNTTAPFGVSTSMSAADYAGDFVDWGTNTICGDAPGTWRTLSVDEWGYLFQGRKNATQLYSKGNIDGLRGMIILPDNWVMPEGLHFTAQPTNLTMELDINTYTQAEWQRMEEAGAVFLCPTGRRDGTKIDYLEYYGGYWSSSKISNSNHVCHMYYNYKSKIFMTDYKEGDYSYGTNGRAVRLVHDTIVPETIPEPCLIVKVNDTLSINMMCVEGGTFMMGQGENAHQVSLSNYSIGQTEVTQALWEAVMGTNPSANTTNKELPVTNISWYACQEFIKKLNQLTGMRFRLPTEAEWEYAARGGQRSKGYTYAGSNDINDVAWYVGNAGAESHIVGTKLPNELGIFDMSGNIWEWCAETFDENDDGQEEGAVHGGAWDSQASTCRVISSRAIRAITYAVKFIGFRLVHDADFTQSPEPEYVDLGLSVKWATFNVGATSPEDYGDYFAWGETEPKETYSWATYKWCDGTSSNITKYNSADGKTVLDLDDDAAYVNWGDKWRMPTKEECQELLDKCTWKEETRNGINGHIVTGPNGNSIFIPTTGYHNDDNGTGVQGLGTITYLWTSSTPGNANAYDLLLSHPTLADGIGSNTRRVGMPIRPVYDEVPDPCLVVKVNDTLSINLMCVEGGTFQMGATPEMDPDALAHEAPVHSVTLSDYYIGQIEVTQALWKTVMGTNPSTIKDNNRPVNNVSWEDCQVFIEKLNQKTGYSFRLPTEAEWEYAARGGNKSRGYKYAGSDNIDEVAWYKDNSGGKYQPSALKKPNELGIYDMSGNVFEWCQDWYGPYSADAQVNPQGPESGPYHMIRGGGWKHIQSNRVTYRRTTGANLDITSIGLRLVLDDTALTPPEPEYVDLGLSVKWATFNVGATSPEDYGDYFAWGETEPKETYSWATYKWCEGTDKTMTKYCSDSNYGNNGFTDNKMELDLSDDAARANWGGNWRMPTDAELTELREQCTWTWTTQDGVYGYKVTSKKSGYTDKSIFLPAAGYRFENSLRLAGEYGYFWSNSLTTDGPNHACFVRFGQYYALGVTDFRRYGFAIRPVYDDRPTLTVIPTPEDAKVSFLCKGYQAVGHSITVDKGKDVLYQVTNVDAGYLSQGDSIYNLTKDSVLYVTLRPFSDGNWVKVDKSEYTKQEGYYVSRNNGGFASHSVWNYYVLPVLPGETYRVRGIAGQHAALWIAASTAPDAATNTRPTKISCCANRGVAAYVADEVTIPDGAKYLIINSRNGKEMMVERKVPDPCLVVKVNDTLSINLMCVEGGTFRMGDDNISNASPAHQVTLSDYYIGQTEVTQTLWKAVMGNVPTGNKNPSYPVGYVSYADCQDFIAKLNNLTGLHFQLPTETEWEYAAMGGNKSHNYIYSGSNTIDDVAWYDQNSENKLHHVGTKQPNELGIYDMSGNAWEWCADYHGKYTAENQINPQGPTTGTGRVIRSGSFRTTADRCTNKHRQAREADYPDSHITLRLVLHDTVPVSPEPEYVDLGLSVKWATFNVGATSPEDDGDYFAWGETETKETYSWATYKWGTSSNLTKYNTTDGKTILDLDDDAAYVNWGGNWRMPSKEEVDELTQQCNWIWTTHNNVNGYKVTGPNGNSIFLPAAGYKGAGPTYPAGEDGLYWTSTLEKGHYSYLIVLHNDAPPTQAGSSGTRCFGFTIRPVYDDRP